MIILALFNRKIFLLWILFIAHTSLLADSIKPSQTNPIKSASRYLFEHPKKAIIFGEEALSNAQTTNNKEDASIALAIIGRAYVNLSDYQTAETYIDSAEAIVQSENDLGIVLEVTRAKIDLLQKQGKDEELTNLIETLLKKAKRQKDKMDQVEILLIQGNIAKQQRKFDEAISIQKDALTVAEEENNLTLMADSYRNLGSTYFQFSRFDEAKEWYNKAKTIYGNLSDTIELIAVLRNTSLAYRDLGQFDQSRENLRIALQLAIKAGVPDLMAEIYNLMGSLSARTGDNTEALNFYNQSLLIREEFDLLSSVAATLENISRVQKELSKFDEARKNLQRVIRIREELNDTRSLGSAYNELGSLLAQKGELADALMHYLTSLKIRQEANLQTDIARSLTNIGLMYRRMGSHKNALKYFKEALELISDRADPIGKAYTYIHIGNTNSDLGKYNEALENYKKSLELRKRTGNQLAISQALRSIATAYSDLATYSEARSYLNQALNILRSLDDEKGIADTYNELGNLALRENKDDVALQYFQDASILFEKHLDSEKRGLCIRKIGEIQTTKGNYDNASDNLNLALSLAKKTKNAKLQELTLLALHNLHLATGQYENALKSYYKHIDIRDSLLAINQKETIWQASLDLELDKKAEEIKVIEGEVEDLRAEAKLKSIQLEQQKLIRNFFAVILLFVIFIAIGSVYGYLIIRQKNKWLNEANEKLAQSESDLKKLVQTKDKLFSIIAHDLRSPFTALVGLTEVLANQATRLEPDEISEYGNIIHESSEKLLNLIDNLLYWSRSQTGKIKLVPQRIRLDKMVADVVSVLELQANTKGIKIENTLDKSLTAIADYDTISTVIRNLTSNAIKYTESKGTITISANQHNNNVDINISDNGVGIDKENLNKLFKIEESFSTKGTSQEAGTGLGLIVCKEFVELNKGTISVKSEVGKGTTFTFTLPS